MTLRLSFFVLLFWLAVSPKEAVGQTELHAQWMELPSEQLLSIGKRDMDNGGRTDTALVCFTIVANRYDSSMKQDEQHACIEANMRLWAIYFYEYYDYPKCFECLIQAHDIAEAIGEKHPDIYLGLGCMYQTISEENANRDLGIKALDYYRQALSASMSIADDEHIDMACTNVLSMASVLDGLHTIVPEWEQYRLLPDTSAANILRRYNKLLYQAYTCIEQGRPDEALAIFDHQLSLIEHTNYARLVFFTYVEKAKIQAKNHDFVGAISTLKHPEQIAITNGMKDCMLEVFGLLADDYRKLGDAPQADRYRERYFMLKDTLTNYHQLAGVNKVEFLKELKQMDRQMTEMRYHREVMSMAMGAAIVVLVVVLVFLFIVFRQNSKLKKTNRSLYQKNVAMLRAEAEEHRMRKQLQERKHEETVSAADEIKYKNSNLTDLDKQALWSRILDVMENTQEIFSPEFSVERLALLTGSKYKYVSQVIHEHSNQNFNAFLNQYRIKEACKHISNVEQYGHLTIEAISSSVGFKSRSTFVTSFKRITGLTPSEYQRLAIEETASRKSLK